MEQDLRPSLFVQATLSAVADTTLTPPFRPLRRGLVDEIGFASSWVSPLSGCPPRKKELHENFYSDRFISVLSDGSVGNPDAVARIEIREAPVYDQYYRCPIDFTGIEIKLTLQEDAFGLFIEPLTQQPQPVAFTLRVPSEAFPFPEQRGGSSPYDPAGKYVTSLNLIHGFEVNKLMVVKSGEQSGVRFARRSSPFL